MLGELELVIGIVVNGIGDVDEFGGGVVNKIEYVDWCNYMIKLIVCVIFFFGGGGVMWYFYFCIDIMILLFWVNILMLVLYIYRGYLVVFVWYLVL